LTSDHAIVLRFFALLAGRGVEFDALNLFEALVAVAGQRDFNLST
jgi:hypothetical protein